MEEERTVASSGFVVTPETIASRTFTTSFRGFDQGEVRTFLKRVSEEVGAAAEREAQLRRLLQDAQAKAAHPEVDEELLTNALGEYAARLLATAREQAAAIRSEAEARAARHMREVEAQIGRIRADADSLLARRVEEVDGVTANLRNAAEAEARAVREQANAEAEAEIQAARNQGREMVAEARGVRERILADLARRRHISEVQLDQLRAARERLLSAYALVRRTLDEATEELKKAEMEARMAADEVGRRAPAPPPPPPPPTNPEDTDPGSRRHEPWPGATPFTPSPLPPSPPPPSAGSPAPRSTMRPGAAAAPARGTRTELAPRFEPRLRPPSRPGEARPTPSRRPSEVEPQPPDQPWSPAHRPESEPAHASAPPAPAPAAPPVPEARVGPPERPSILPRPVAPPPPREVARQRQEPPPVTEEPAPLPETDRVDELFARIKADRAGAIAASMPAPTTPEEAPADDAASAAVVPSDAVFVDERPPAPEPLDRATSIADESARARRDELLDPIEETLVRQLKRVLQDEQNEVLDRLRRKRRRRSGPALPDPEEQTARFREVAESILGDAVRAGVRFGSPAASEAHADEGAARSVAEALALEVSEPLRMRLDRCFADADDDTAEGASSNGDLEGAELSERISAVYRQWRAQEIEPLARHHAVSAFALGAFAAYAQETPLRWVVDEEGRCPDCDDNALAGPVAKGQPYPTGQLHPPAHPGCRCILVPTVP